MNRKLLLIICILTAGSGLLSGQSDVHFSQFYYSPIMWNPAMAGVTSGDLRASATYRNQWASVSSPYTTISAAFDMPVQTRAMGDNFLGFGVYFNNDKSGNNGFSNLDINGSLSYSLDLGSTYNRPHYISFGLNFGFVQRSMAYDNATWDIQWDGLMFDPLRSNGEGARTGKLSKGNISVGGGAVWNYSFQEKQRFYLGAALFHINRPNLSIIGDSDHLFHKFAYMAGFDLGSDSRSTTFRPNVMVMHQGPNFFLTGGLDVSFDLTDRTAFTNYKNHMAFGVGVYHRLMDAMIFAVNVEYSNLKVGFAYDLNISEFNLATDGKGGMEIILLYQPQLSGPATQRQKLRRNKGL